mgnify:CR=1 FL=1|tara:strand:- start:10741 stop:11061 length:321 start_codon:yes stop_codon:yes gene_type:complete
MNEIVGLYGEAGAVAVIVGLFIMMIKNLMTSQTSQSEDLDDIRQHIAVMETKISNSESIIIKLISRWDRSDSTTERRHEKLTDELNQISDVVAEIKGSVSRINGKH